MTAPTPTPTPRYGSIEWLERMREAVRDASHADTGAIRNSLMKLSQTMNTFYGEEWGKHHAARAQPPAPASMVEALPDGCPTEMSWGGYEKKLHQYEEGYCQKFGCTPVEIHPVGTREMLARMGAK